MGVGIVDSEGDELTMRHFEVIAPARRDPIDKRLHFLFTGLNRVIEDLGPSAVAIEQPFAGENKRAAMAIGHAQAVAMLAAATHGLPVSSYAPRQVKQSVTDYGGSSKEQVRDMVRVLLDLDEAPDSLDATDALAVAICHINAAQIEMVTIIE